MAKTQVYLRGDELAALRKAAARSGRSVADIVREAIRKQYSSHPPSGRSPAAWIAGALTRVPLLREHGSNGDVLTGSGAKLRNRG